MSSYGEVCNETHKCDREAWLGCYSGICDCWNPDEMIFEPTTGECASKAGERCKYDLEHSDGSKTIEYTRCVRNSVCDVDGFCACNEEFYENANSTCSLPGQLSDTCDATAKCSSVTPLVCLDGICKCPDKISTPSLNQEQCVGLAGHACISSQCTENALCRSETCVCTDGYFQNSDNKCSRKLNRLANCTTDDQCIYEGGLTLKCVDGTCHCDPDVSLFGSRRAHQGGKCDSHFHGFYEQYNTGCLGKVGKPCISNACAVGSFCQYDNRCADNGPGNCVCRPEFYETNKGTCGRDYNEYCNSADGCMDGLVCGRDNDRCRCRYANQIYDITKKICLSPVGGTCGTNSGCVDGTECVKVRNNTRGTCQYKEGFVEGTFGKCDTTFGKPCTDEIGCDEIVGLSCIEDVCQCDDFKQFDLSTKTCLGLVSCQCNPNVTSQQCVSNSSCLKAREGHTIGRCTCNKGHIVTRNYTCELELSEVENPTSFVD